MARLTYILCPGQGAQVVGMGKDFCEASPTARAFFDSANNELGFDLKSLCFSGPEEELNKTNVSQPAIYVTSVACYHAVVAAGIIEPNQITAYAGLSLGEYTALYLAGAFDFLTGLKLVRARGAYMQAAAEATPGGMVAIMGADESAAEKLCQEAAQGEVLVPANFNAPGQIVLSGSKGACERAIGAAGAAGFKAVPLVVAGAFHSPLMQSGAERMAHELDGAAYRAPGKTVYANVTAQPYADRATMKGLLVDQIVRPVRWEQTMQTLVAAGGAEARFVELAPGRVLTGLLKKINRRLAVESLATAEAIRAMQATGL
jgi:[acyl-carrier-protein] S-malonyltransferase